MTLDKAIQAMFVREGKRREVWLQWKALGKELPEHYTLLEGELKKEFDAEVANR